MGATGLRAALLSLALLGSGWYVADATAQVTDRRLWERYMERGSQSLAEGREQMAENWFLDAAREAERQDPRSPELAQTLSRLVQLYRKQGRHSDAEVLVQRLSGLARTGAAKPGAEVITALESYAALLRESGRERDAGAVLRRAQRLREVRAGGSRGELLFFNPVAELRDYAMLLRQRNRHDEARAVDLLAAAEARLLIDRYENLRKGLATESAAPSITWSRQIVGAKEALEGRLWPEAEGLLNDAVKNAETFPPNDARLAYSVSVLAFAQRAQGKTAEFDRSSQRAMTLLEKAASHMLVPRSLTVLALSHLRFELEPGKALAHFERGLRLVERELVRDHPVVGLHHAGLAASHLALSQPDQAKPSLERALAIAGQQYLPDHVPLALGLMKVVDVYEERGDYARASAIAQRVVTILGKMLDPDHPDVIMAVEEARLLAQKTRRQTATVALSAATTIPIQVVGNALHVYATINRSQRALLVVDTGATTTVIRPLLLRRLGASVPDSAPRRRVFVVSGQSLDVPFVTLTVQVGDATVENLEVGVAEAFPGHPDLDGLLGADFLQRFRVILETSTRRMTLEPISR